MTVEFTRRELLLTAAVAALAGCSGDGDGDDDGESGGDRARGPTLNRFATTIIGAEVTGMYVTERGEFFFNVQHPDPDLDGEPEPGIVGAVAEVDVNELPEDFPSVQVPESDDGDYSDSGGGEPEPHDRRVRTALGGYQRLARGGDPTDDGRELGTVYAPDGEVLAGQINPDFNGFVQSSEHPAEGYLFTNWEHRPGPMSRLHLRREGANGRWEVLGAENVDFSGVEGTWVNCFGTVSPWGTPLTSEENYAIRDTPVWNDPGWSDRHGVERLARHLGYEPTDEGCFAEGFPNPYRYGYIVEITDPETDPTPEKRFAVGRATHENAVVMPDRRTAYTTSDGSARAFYKFRAAEPGDLSSGTLYAAKAVQQGPIGGDPADVGFTLEWIELGRGSDEEIEHGFGSAGSEGTHVATFDGVTQADYTDGETSYITDAAIEEWAAARRDGRVPDRLRPVPFLEARSAATALGATVEFRKMEGINVRRNARPGEDYAYVAMSNTNATMSDDEGDVRLDGDEWGAVYRLRLLREGEDGAAHDYDVRSMEPVVTGGPNANVCGGCPMDARPDSRSTVCRACQYNPTRESEAGVVGRGLEELRTVFSKQAVDPENTISEPDNVVVLGDGRVVIGEDTRNRGHENNMIWVYDPGGG